MNDLLVIVPSRNRAANVARLLFAFLPPCAADLLICQDDDDPAYRLEEAQPVSRTVRRVSGTGSPSLAG